ncbi:MAG: hypothetical protein N4R59_05570, partial [Lactobacillus iners]|nr:hypothetical protein [Lactobacillus iners]
KVIRSDVNEVKRTGRTTQGVTLAKPDKGDEIISIARNEEKDDENSKADESQESSEFNSQESQEINESQNNYESEENSDE